MKKATLLKKLLAVSLALIFMLSMPGMSAIAEAAQIDNGQNSVPLSENSDNSDNGGESVTPLPQVVDAGGTLYFTKDAKGNLQPADAAAADPDLVMTKTVAHPDGYAENEFEVTLQVVTTENLEEIPASTPSCAVVLVIDVSNSMDDCAICASDSSHNPKGASTVKVLGHDFQDRGRSKDGKCDSCGKTEAEHTVTIPAHNYVSRLEQAKEAAKQFINTFANNTGAREGDKRLVQIVAFGSNAKNYTSKWYDVNDKKDKEDNIAALDEIIGSGLYDGIRVANGNGNSYGGTNIEGGLMLAKNIFNADLPKNKEDTTAALAGIGYLYTVMLTDGNPTFYVSDNNSSNSTTGITGTRGGGTSTTNNDVKDVKTQADAIKGLGSTTGAISKLYSICYGQDGKGNSVFDSKAFGEVTLSDKPTGKSWSNTSVGEWLDSFSTAAYKATDSTSLFDSFSAIGDTIKIATQAWKVEDSMGSNISFSGAVSGGLENDVTSSAKELTWNLRSSSFVKNPKDEAKKLYTYTYTYKYKVKLDNLDYISNEDAIHNVNTKAELSVLLTDGEGNWLTEMQKKEFPVPTVKAFEDELTFKKVGPSGKAISGAKFTLTTADKTDWVMEETSGENGTVTFSNIPSGHTYTLTETEAPEGYETVGPFTVNVDYGVVSVQDSDGKAVSSSITDPYTTGDLKITKTVVGSPDGIDSKEFTFTITADDNTAKKISDEKKFEVIAGTATESVMFTKDSTTGKCTATLTLKAAEAKTINGLPIGTYTVTEDEKSAGIENWKLEVTGGGEANVTLRAVKSPLAIPIPEKKATYP